MLLQQSLPQTTCRLGELLKAIAPVRMQGQYLLGWWAYEGFFFTILQRLLVGPLETLPSALQINLLNYMRLQHILSYRTVNLIRRRVHFLWRQSKNSWLQHTASMDPRLVLRRRAPVGTAGSSVATLVCIVG